MDKSFDSKKYYKVNVDFIIRDIAGDSLLVPTGEAASALNGMIKLNEPCSFLWNFFKQPHTIQEAVIEAKKTYDDKDQTMERDIYDMVTEFVAMNLMREVNNI